MTLPVAKRDAGTNKPEDVRAHARDVSEKLNNAIRHINTNLGLSGIADLSDPNADRAVFWDDSAGVVAWLAPSTGITISASTMRVVESDINHDNLTGFVSNEHIDWTSTSSNLTTSGTIRGGKVEVDGATFFLDTVSSVPRVTFDTNDYLELNSNQFGFYVGGTKYLAIDSAAVYFDSGVAQFSRSGNGTDVQTYRSDNHGSFVSIATWTWYGTNSTPSQHAYGQWITYALGNTAGSESSRHDLSTRVSGSLGVRFIVEGGVYHPSATGGNKGDNTINYGAVYDDNTLLTCYAPELMDDDGAPVPLTDTEIDAKIAEWDAKVPDVYEYDIDDVKRERPRLKEARGHIGARKFFARLKAKNANQGEYDPRDIDDQIRHYRDKKHLTPYPNPATFQHSDLSTGEWVQRGIEMDELLGMYIYRAHRKIKALEAELATVKTAAQDFKTLTNQRLAALDARVKALEGA